MAGRIAGKVALVTGAGSGIGQATAELFAEEGARVVVTDIDVAAAEAAATRIATRGGQALALELDATDEADWESVIDRVLAGWGRIDILVNNAGIASSAPLADSTLADFRRVVAVNLDSVFLGTQRGIRVMRGAGGGSIVNVASASGKKASAGAGAYCASKAAVVMLTKVAALEGAPHRVRVNAVLPAGVETPMWEKQPFFQALVKELGDVRDAYTALAKTSPFARFAAPREVAAAILMCASDESSYVTGAEIVVDGGYTA
ncbi:SDR family NAD(P)-dependent oxidoreductase [Polyangium sp. 15x6]|uniref:SDR family NAD(P)-dependent oxidoreductase n=1 Tax=Polyangium sp. 15x6 TaxID=3042687 RepID=UPI00249BD88B|nr:SDR family NAD(P)-dependent oxidoreductase [Polyangium sp. 15x6]MDI3286773.1 SDR family NAD(P)-dependent oxidoreductase [Polyangium sp. 15x6]